jgi:hypothetical protein
MITVDLFEILQHVWQTLCVDYDVTTELPDIGSIFAEVDPSMPDEAAQRALVNLLSEVMEHTSRFSPWYKQPASAFGIMLSRDIAPQARRWVLTDEAIQQCHQMLRSLTKAIERNRTVILATHFLDEIDPYPEQDVLCRTATCQCMPPRTILIQSAIHARIICDTCRQPFT